jgi:ABC-type transport system involved in cytochrome c biogenesis permease component
VTGASDPTGLFVILFGVPALLFAVVFAAVALKAPRGGAALSGMLFASVVPVVFWARSAGYFSGAGLFLLSSLVISGCGVAIGIFKLVWPSASIAKKDDIP